MSHLLKQLLEREVFCLSRKSVCSAGERKQSPPLIVLEDVSAVLWPCPAASVQRSLQVCIFTVKGVGGVQGVLQSLKWF